MIWRGWMRMIGPSGSPSALAASSSAEAVQRHFAGQLDQGEIRQLRVLSERILQQTPESTMASIS